MNIIDLRTGMRRSPVNSQATKFAENDRRKGDRRHNSSSEQSEKTCQPHRVWLTPGEKALIEDLYLLDS